MKGCNNFQEHVINELEERMGYRDAEVKRLKAALQKYQRAYITYCELCDTRIDKDVNLLTCYICFSIIKCGRCENPTNCTTCDQPVCGDCADVCEIIECGGYTCMVCSGGIFCFACISFPCVKHKQILQPHIDYDYLCEGCITSPVTDYITQDRLNRSRARVLKNQEIIRGFKE